jgi:prepilin-type N-terminal cleavage/methylation domain-containing protein
MLSSAVKRARAARNDQSGFTLIELLIVIVILGVLAGIVVFSVSGITDRGKTSACQTSVNTIDTAAEAFVANSTAATPPAASSLTLTQLAPYLHSTPTKVGTNAVTGATTVGTVDGFTC